MRQTSLIDFDANIVPPSISVSSRIAHDGLVVCRHAASANPGIWMAAAQVTLVVHEGPPFELAWHPLDRRLAERHTVTSGQFHVTPAHHPVHVAWRGTQHSLTVAWTDAFIQKAIGETFDGKLPELRPRVGLHDPEIEKLVVSLRRDMDMDDRYIPMTDLDRERQRLSDTGILAHLDKSCAGTKPLAVHYAASSGKDELLTSISPLHTNAGCWVILTSYGYDYLAGSSLARPFSEAPEVRLAMLLYAAIILLTVMAVVGTLVDLRSFSKLARQIRRGGQAGAETFSEVTAIPELIPVAGEFDRMVDTLNASARAMREAAEDNVHAFKGPIAAMTQSIEPLRHSTNDNPRARQALEVIEQTLERLTDLVQGVRRLDEAAADLINARLQNVDLARLIRDMADAFQRIHSSIGIHIIAKETGTAWVAATEDSLETVVENLLDNAVGFSPESGTVTMTVTTVDSMVRLIVEDEGPGVPADQLEAIFRRNFSSRPTEGRSKQMETAHFGIGLAIVRRTVEILGGHIRAENRPDGGLRITIEFPAA